MPLVLASKLDTDNRIKCFIANRMALDPETGVYMYCSAGRRKAGRPAKYTVHISNDTALHVTAFSDQEAVDKANKMLGLTLV